MNKCLCKCCCGIEFDTIGLYVNFENGELPTVRYLFEKFMKKYDVNVDNVEIAYNYPTFIELQKYGQHKEMLNASWLQTLGCKRINTFIDFRSKNESYIKLFNYVINSKSIAMFIGELTNEMFAEYESYRVAGVISIIHLTPDFQVKVVSPIIPDREKNFYLDNLS